MRILVFGAGVIGSTYAWQLSEAGYDVSMFIRKHRMVRYRHSGISINCTDLRENKEMLEVIERHMKHGFDEMKKQYYDILNDGKKHNINMLYWQSYEAYILKTENTRNKQGLV